MHRYTVLIVLLKLIKFNECFKNRGKGRSELTSKFPKLQFPYLQDKDNTATYLTGLLSGLIVIM